MQSFNFVIFGFTSNLAQLKIIPALYDLEAKGKLANDTKIIGIGRKDLDIQKYVTDVLHQENRHHKHLIIKDISQKLVDRITYLKEDFEDNDGKLYEILKESKGNILYYLATYPDLYHKIFQSLKNNNLDKSNNGWVRIMIEKPISRLVNDLVHDYFDEDQIYRVDHYLGKENLRKVFDENIDIKKIKKVVGTIYEDFGIGKRGVYYDSVGALLDMGQNHLLQMIASVFTKGSSNIEREEVLKNLIVNSKEIYQGQYEGYLDEESVKKDSTTDTFFALKTSYKDIPIIISSGKFLHKNEAKIAVYFTDGSVKNFLISPTEKDDSYDPYERLILDAVRGDINFFNSKKEIELSWDFIEKYQNKNKKLDIYKKGSNFFNTVSAELST